MTQSEKEIRNTTQEFITKLDPYQQTGLAVAVDVYNRTQGQLLRIGPFEEGEEHSRTRDLVTTIFAVHRGVELSIHEINNACTFLDMLTTDDPSSPHEGLEATDSICRAFEQSGFLILTGHQAWRSNIREQLSQ